jgi:predicted heme/steroid binding protein
VKAATLCMVLIISIVSQICSLDEEIKDPIHDDPACDSSSSQDGGDQCKNPTSETVGTMTTTTTIIPDIFEPKFSTKGIRLITKEELATKKGEGGSAIWLSVLGEVYDVTDGRSYYAQGHSYGAFAATDCSVCFITGTFNAEEAEKSIDVLETKQLLGLIDWKKFYATHESYKFVGLLVDPRFYDDQGEPTESMLNTRQRAATLVKPKSKR